MRGRYFLQSTLAAGLNLDGEGGIPVAYDHGCGYGSCTTTFHDFFDGTVDLSSLVVALAAADTSADALADTAG